ncbi:hypothetical protein CYY_006530 [Polysphondylium violaceum]|uniref:A-kinase anchor protein 7-like phosphoesterase domain-containing protein n=1 Tax=Polysphondylium violaceum TaxID=133409 RepID=A0A8J4PTB2_9MYCE|nr:hypothetical protein CYY_006530 [Polysphondylium violaceum]
MSRRNNYQQQQQDRPRPNYFLGLQITSPEISNSLIVAQKEFTTRGPGITRSLITPSKFHLTVFVMNLPTQDDLDKVKGLLPKIKEIRSTIYDTTPIVNVCGIGSFYDRVIWAGLKQDENRIKLDRFVKDVTTLFQQNGVDLEDRWSPHITLAKGKTSDDFVKAITYCNSQYHDKEFGIQTFKSLDLLKIGSTDPITKYYSTLDTLSLE